MLLIARQQEWSQKGDVEFHVLTPNKIELLHVVIHKAFVQFLVALRQLETTSL